MEIRDSGFPTPIPSTMSMHAEEGTDDLNALAMDQKKVNYTPKYLHFN